MLWESNSGMGESGLETSLETKPFLGPCASLHHRFSLRSSLTSLDPSCLLWDKQKVQVEGAVAKG